MTAEDVIRACSKIPSSVHEPEQRLWWEKLHDLPGHPVIVDFGTGHGKSAASLALSCPQGMVYTFDPGLPYINAGCDELCYEEETKKFIADTGAVNVVFTRESSLEKGWPGANIDVLNIDSDHTYETTLLEVGRWVPLVKPGGYIFLHDWEHPRCPGVRQAWDELVPSKIKAEFQYATQAGEIKCAWSIKL